MGRWNDDDRRSSSSVGRLSSATNKSKDTSGCASSGDGLGQEDRAKDAPISNKFAKLIIRTLCIDAPEEEDNDLTNHKWSGLATCADIAEALNRYGDLRLAVRTHARPSIRVD